MKLLVSIFFAIALFLGPVHHASGNDTAAEDYEKALQSFYQKDINEAYIHLKNALQKDPAHLPSKILMGETLLSNGNTKDAVIELIEAVEFGADENLTTLPLAQAYLLLENYTEILAFSEQRLDPNKKFELQLLKASAHHNLNQTQRALRTYQAALKSRPQSIRAINSLASYHLIEENYESAAELLQRSIRLDQNDPRTLNLLGQLAKVNANSELAFSYFERAYSENPNDPIIKRSIASAYMDKQDYASARKIVSEILEQTPDDPFAMLLNGRLQSLNRSNEIAANTFDELSQKLTMVPDEIKSKRPDLLFVTAMSSYLSGSYEKAARELQAYLLKSPSNINALGILADTYLKLDQVPQAETLLDRQQRSVVKNLGLGLVLCDLYLETGKNFKCDSLLDQLKRIHGDNLAIDFMRVEVLQSRQKYNEAIALFERSFPDPDSVDLLYASADLYIQNDEPTKALQSIDKLIALEPKNNVFKLRKSDVLLSVGDTNSARPLVEGVLDNEPSSFDGRLNLTRILFTERNFLQAETLAKTLVDESSSSINALTMLGRTLIAQDKFDEALQVLERAKGLTNDNPLPSELIARIYIEQNDFEQALYEFDDLTKSDFLNADYTLAKAQIYLQLDDFENASKQLNVLFGIWNDDPSSLLLLSQLQTQAEDNKNALRSLEKAIQLAPQEVALQLEMVRLRIARDELQLAKNVAVRLLKQEPQNANVALVAGEVALAMNDEMTAYKHYLDAFKLDTSYQLAAAKLYQLATQGIGTEVFVSEMTKLLSEQPEYYFQRNLLGDFYMTQNQFELAKQSYEQLINVPNIPNKENIFNNLANIVMMDNLELANQFADKALELEAQSSAIIDTKGWILTKQLKYTEALTFLRRAFALDSSDPSIRYHIAYTLHRLGRSNEARIELDAALSSERNFGEREDAIALQLELENTPS